MMAGAWPGMTTPAGGVHCAPAGACGGEIRIAEMFWAKGSSFVAGRYPKSWLSGAPKGAGPAGGPPPAGGAPRVTGASIGRVTASCTVVVEPTNTGSVLRGPGPGPPASGTPVSYSVWYHGPHEPSGRFARTRVEVPARSPVSATSENGVAWVISRTVTPAPSPTKACSASWVSEVRGGAGSPAPGGRFSIHATMTTVAATAVSNIVGARLRDGTNRCYVCV